MSMAVAIFATLAGTIGASAFYLASPNQRLLKRAWGKGRGIAAGGALILLSLLLYLTVAGPATAVFILMTLLMTVWSVPPLGIAYARRGRGTRR